MDSSRSRLKAAIVGDSGVGKSTLLQAISLPPNISLENSQSTSTVGVDFNLYSFMSRQKKMYQIQFWDTAGQERFKSLVPSYLRNMDIYLLVFSLVSPSSLLNLESWMQMIKEARASSGFDYKTVPSFFLFGNKSDLVDEVAEYENKHEMEITIKDFMEFHNINLYFAISAKMRKVPVEDFLDEVVYHHERNSLGMLNTISDSHVSLVGDSNETSVDSISGGNRRHLTSTRQIENSRRECTC